MPCCAPGRCSQGLAREAYMADLNVLMVEDLERWRNLFDSALKEVDAKNISCARHKEEARAYLENNTFDLIILDLRIPENEYDNGAPGPVNLNLLNEITTRGRNKLCGIIITSAHGDIALVNKAKRKLTSSIFLKKRIPSMKRNLYKAVSARFY